LVVDTGQERNSRRWKLQRETERRPSSTYEIPQSDSTNTPQSTCNQDHCTHYINQLQQVIFLICLCLRRFPLDSHDADFGIIERATKKTANIFLPEQWCSVSKKCNRKNKFCVVRMQSDTFKSVNELSKTTTVRKQSETGESG